MVLMSFGTMIAVRRMESNGCSDCGGDSTPATAATT
jgi:hypothetical protein